MLPIAIFHEHPDRILFRPLFAELDRRGVSYVADRKNALLRTTTTSDNRAYSLVFNRANPSAYLRGRSGNLGRSTHCSGFAILDRVGVASSTVHRPQEWTSAKATDRKPSNVARIPYPGPRLARQRGGRRRGAAPRIRYPVLAKANVEGAVLVHRTLRESIGLERAAGEWWTRPGCRRHCGE